MAKFNRENDTVVSNTDGGIDVKTDNTGFDDETGGIETQVGKNEKTDGIGFEDQPDIKSETVASPGKKRRGRPPGVNKTKETLGVAPKEKTEKPSPKSVSNLGGMIVTANNFVAMRQNAPEFVIGEGEGKTLAEPVSEILALWGIRLDGGDNPYLKLVAAMIGVYGIRVVGYRMRVAMAVGQPPSSPDVPTRTYSNSKPMADFSALQ